MRETRGNAHGVAAIAAAFTSARVEGRRALITYLTLGYPSKEDSLTLVPALQAGGADIIELGIPFSDPVADGPTIQRASYLALQAGISPADCLALASSLRELGVTVPLVFMGYYNPIYAYGLETYVRDCYTAGVDGLIVADLPLEEAEPLRAVCGCYGLALILLIAPTTGSERVARIAMTSNGFVYVVSRLGTTGTTAGPGEDVVHQCALIKRYSDIPIAVGFGISHPNQVQHLPRDSIDGIIVGSAVVEKAQAGATALQRYVASLRVAI